MRAAIVTFVAEAPRTLREMKQRFAAHYGLMSDIKALLNEGEILEQSGRYFTPKLAPKTNGEGKTMSTPQPPKKPNADEKLTADSLRTALWDEIQALRRGESNEKRAHALAKLVDTTLRTVEVEIEARRYQREIKELGAPAEGPLQLIHQEP